jgi:phage baseplate assembly protein W
MNILSTNHYERPFRPRFGGNIRHYLFENITPATLQIIKSNIISVINTFEPRANVLDVVVSAGSDENTLAITITFSLINNTKPNTLNLTLALDRLR